MSRKKPNNATALAILELDCLPDILIDRTIWIARTFHCKVHLVLYEPELGTLFGGLSVSTEADRIRKEMRQTQEAIVEDYGDKMRGEGIDVTTSVSRIRPIGDGLLELSETVDPQIVIKASRRHSVAERSILVDSDWQLMRMCPQPLWLVRSETMPEKPLVVAAVDPANTDDKPASLDNEIVRNAKTVAEKTDGELHLLHAYERLVGIGIAANRAITASQLPVDEIDARIKAEHQNALDALANSCKVDNDRAHLMPGRANEIIPTFARSLSAGLVVMGVLARWGLKRKIIGSTAERVVDHIASDVLIVRLGDSQLYDWA
jgi:universal stress protein E